MSERTTNMVVLGAALVALVVIVVGLASADTAEPTAEDRVAALSEAIKCPFCSGESLAESPSGVAAEYRALIAERVAAGYTDEEIRQEFADNFGESYILDTSASSWSLALWVVPVLALIAGGGVIYWMRKSAKDRGDAEVGASDG
ncbi:MAG: cytochrome c-type biogenesis protein [Acidimicrobiia bacterium]